MKQIVLSFVICLASTHVVNAQNLLDNLARTAKSQAQFTVTSQTANAVRDGVNSVLSGNIFGKKKDTSKGTDESLVSYLNPTIGFKGQYPKSYTRTEEDGQVMFSSTKHDINIVYCGLDDTTLGAQYQNVIDEVNANYELLESQNKDDNFTVKYNMGGTVATVHAISKDSRVAMVMIAYPEDQVTSYKKLIGNIQKSLQFFK